MNKYISKFMHNSEINPQNILASAIREVPAVRYALGVAGVAAAVALILGLLKDVRIAFFGIAFTLALMVVLLIFSHMVEDLPGKKWMAAFLAWIVITLFSAMLVLTFTSFVFGFPQKFALFLQTNTGSSETASERPQNIIGSMEDLPKEEVAKLKPDSSPSTDERQKQIEWRIHNESSWVVRELVVKLTIRDESDDILFERYYRLRLSDGSSGEPYKTSEYTDKSVFPAEYSGVWNTSSFHIESAKGVKQ
jgi:hypothetical protein